MGTTVSPSRSRRIVGGAAVAGGQELESNILQAILQTDAYVRVM